MYIALQAPHIPLNIQRQCNILEDKLCDVHDWLEENKLKGNPDKTEVSLIGSKETLRKIDLVSIKVAGISVSISKVPVRNLGVLFDSALSMDPHARNVVRCASFHLRNVGIVRKQLTTDATKQLLQAIVISRLDYANSCLAGISNATTDLLQLVQNRAARLVSRTKISSHITPVLKYLHWLPVYARIKFKVLMLTFMALNGLAPCYLSELVSPYVPARTLRSEGKNLLAEPKYRLSSFGGKAFSTLAPRLWNSLPASVRNVRELSVFKVKLKTFLFREHFGV